MVKKWGIVLAIITVVIVLYVIEISKIDIKPGDASLNLDDLNARQSDQQWDPFYRVRAEITDGQTAVFTIPDELKKAVGKEMELTGAAVFFSNGCYAAGDSIAVQSLFLLPSLGLANACVHLPDVAMRWTILINLEEDWLISRTDMIQTMISVKGIFRIDTGNPFDAAFYLDRATVQIIPKMEDSF